MAPATRTAPRSVKSSPAPVDVATVQTAADHALSMAALASPATPVVQPDAHCQDYAAQLPDVPVQTAPACNLADGFYPPVAPPTAADMLSALMAAPTTAKPTGRGCGTATVKPVKRADAPVQTTTYSNGAVVPLGRGNDGAHGVARAKDLPWCPKKAAVLSALSSMGATSIASCRATKDVAATAGVNDVCVRHYCYHAASAGLCGVVTAAFGRQQGFYLTDAGAAALAQYVS